MSVRFIADGLAVSDWEVDTLWKLEREDGK